VAGLKGLAAVGAVDVLVAVAVRAAYGGAGALSTVAGIVLGAVAVAAVHRIATRIGPRFALGAAAMVFVVPFLGALYALSTYRSTYLHHALPALFGLTHTGWFAVGVGVAVAVALAPDVVTGAGGAVAIAVAVAVWGVAALGDVQGAVHETGWSVTFIEWLPVAAVAGLARRAPWLTLGAAGWLVLVVLRAAHRSFADGAFWAALAPAVPAAALLVAAIALLVPRRSPAARPAPEPR
jgi:hypothetical protein